MVQTLILKKSHLLHHRYTYHQVISTESLAEVTVKLPSIIKLPVILPASIAKVLPIATLDIKNK